MTWAQRGGSGRGRRGHRSYGMRERGPTRSSCRCGPTGSCITGAQGQGGSGGAHAALLAQAHAEGKRAWLPRTGESVLCVLAPSVRGVCAVLLALFPIRWLAEPLPMTGHEVDALHLIPAGPGPGRVRVPPPMRPPETCRHQEEQRRDQAAHTSPGRSSLYGCSKTCRPRKKIKSD